MARVARSGDTSRVGAANHEVPKLEARKDTIEERYFSGALICLEAHCAGMPTMGPLTTAKIASMISKTLEKTHNFKHVRETLSRNVGIWMWLTRIFATAIPTLTVRSVGPLSPLNEPESGANPQESTSLIMKNYSSLREDLQLLNRLMHIARNMLVTPEPEVAQDICAAVQFDQMVYQTIILCVNVTSKGFDGEVLDDGSREKLNEITEIYKKLLVTSLQQAHNWTSKNDRNKMSFWFNVLFDEGAATDERDSYGSTADFRTSVAKTEVFHWLERNSRMCEKARRLLLQYQQNQRHRLPGKLPTISPLAWNWTRELSVEARPEDAADEGRRTPHWNEGETDKFKQDQLYGRVSREIDTWWLKVRDTNYDAWVVPMPSVDFAQQRTESCRANLFHRYSFRNPSQEHEDEEEEEEGEGEGEGDEEDEDDDSSEEGEDDSGVEEPQDEDDGSCPEGCSQHALDQGRPVPETRNGGNCNHDYADEDEDVDDDDSYGEGPMTGMLTEVPNILDPKQIEALHMIVKSCILDNAGLGGLTRVGENMQKTRCRMFLALEGGKSLLREMLVFIAVWEKDEQSLIFQITTQMVEAMHHSALIPYAWQSLRIPKDITSPAQTVLLRLIECMFRARNNKPPATESKENVRDIKLLHFLFIQFRSRLVPECIALMYLQEEVRKGKCDAADFPVDNWDMERAKDGLHMFLEFLATVSQLPETRSCLIAWEATYELVALLKALEAGVPKKPLVDLPSRSTNRPAPNPPVEEEDLAEPEYRDDNELPPPPPPPPPPPMQEHTYEFAWSGIKGHVLTILAALLQPPPGKVSPGNPTVQAQVVKHNGIVPLLNCCVYDDHNRFARERVQICLKWLMDGSDAANDFLRCLVHASMPPSLQQPTGAAPAQATVRVDGIAAEIKVQVRASSAGPSSGAATSHGGPSLPPLISASTTVGELHDILAAEGGGTTLPPIQIRNGALSFAGPNPVASLAAASQSLRQRPEVLLRDIVKLADEAARLALEHATEDTEEEDFI